MYPCSPDLD